MNIYEILKQLPKETVIYNMITGQMETFDINEDKFGKYIRLGDFYFTHEGSLASDHDTTGECLIFPSKEHRTWKDWKEFYEILKQPRFKPFDKVLVRNSNGERWVASYFSHYRDDISFHYSAGSCYWKYCIPFEGNECLAGTVNKPE